jgi:hypothetical protein
MAFRRKSSDESSDELSPVSKIGSEEKISRIVFQSQKNKPTTPRKEQVTKPDKDFLPDIRVARSRSRSPVRQIRRGEQGKSIEEIKKMEKAGFVMSGSRRRQPEAPPVSEKEVAAKRLEERAKKEELLIDHFRQLVIKNNQKHNT